MVNSLSSCVIKSNIHRLLKIRCNKTKFQTWSKSTGTLFQNVLDEMMKCARDKPLGKEILYECYCY